MEDAAPPATTAPVMTDSQSPPPAADPAPAPAQSDGEGEEPGSKRKQASPKKEKQEPRAGSRSSKRQRTAVKMFKPAEIKEKKDLVIPEGEGTKLGNHPNVKRNLDKYQAVDTLLKAVHKILYGTPGKKTTIKKEIRAFNGYEPGSDTTKNQQAIERLTVAVLTDVVRLLDARKANSSGNKEEMAEALLAFLMKPEPSEGTGLYPSKAAPKKKKKSTKKKGKGKKKKAKKKGPKRGPSSYFLFCADERANVRAEMPELNGVSEEAKELGRRWKALTEEEREKYKAKAAKHKPKKAEAEGEDTDSEESEDEYLGEEGKMRATIRKLLRDLSKSGEVSSKQVRKSLKATFGDVVETKKAWVKGLIRDEYAKME